MQTSRGGPSAVDKIFKPCKDLLLHCDFEHALDKGHLLIGPGVNRILENAIPDEGNRGADACALTVDVCDVIQRLDQ